MLCWSTLVFPSMQFFLKQLRFLFCSVFLSIHPLSLQFWGPGWFLPLLNFCITWEPDWWVYELKAFFWVLVFLWRGKVGTGGWLEVDAWQFEMIGLLLPYPCQPALCQKRPLQVLSLSLQSPKKSGVWDVIASAPLAGFCEQKLWVFWMYRLKARRVPHRSYSDQHIPSSSVPQGSDPWGSEEEVNLNKMGKGVATRGEPSPSLAGHLLEPRHTLPKFHIFIFLFSSFHLSV